MVGSHVDGDIAAGKFVFTQIPVNRGMNFAAVAGAAVVSGLNTPVRAKGISFRVITDMAGMDNHQIFTVMGVRAMTVTRHNAADLSMIKGEGTEMLCQQNDRVALAFIRAKRT